MKARKRFWSRLFDMDGFFSGILNSWYRNTSIEIPNKKQKSFHIQIQISYFHMIDTCCSNTHSIGIRATICIHFDIFLSKSLFKLFYSGNIFFFIFISRKWNTCSLLLMLLDRISFFSNQLANYLFAMIYIRYDWQMMIMVQW